MGVRILESATETLSRLESYREQVGADSARKICTELLRYLSQWQMDLRAAITAKDIAAKRKLVHQLRGIAGLWHHPDLDGFFQVLLGTDPADGDAATLETNINQCIEDVIREIRQFMDDLPMPGG